MIQSNRSKFAIAASSEPKSSGSPNSTSGRTTGIAPSSASTLASASLCGAARVMTILFPAREDRAISATLPAHFFQDGLRTCFNQQSRHVFPERCRLVRRCRGTLFHILHSIHGTDTCFEHQLAAFDTRPRTQRHLPSSLQRCHPPALGNDRGSRFRVVQRCQNVGRLRIL